jgi:hypothetical protein
VRVTSVVYPFRYEKKMGKPEDLNRVQAARERDELIRWHLSARSDTDVGYYVFAKFENEDNN